MYLSSLGSPSIVKLKLEMFCQILILINYQLWTKPTVLLSEEKNVGVDHPEDSL